MVFKLSDLRLACAPLRNLHVLPTGRVGELSLPR
jgi:hypothetical protein